MEKKYYWLKLKEDFFEEKQIKYLRKLPDGDRLVIAYLKMQLKSLRTEGLIQYDRILPSNEDELAMILDEDANVVKLMLQALMQVKAIEILDDGSFYMIAMQDLIGREGQSAERVRRFREKQKQLALQCNTNVTKCNTEIEIEKEIEKDIDIDVDVDVNNDNAKIVKCYEENIGLLTPASVELIFSYLDVFNADIICEAIKKASVANVRNTKYICGILKDWKNKGIKTLVDIDTEQQKRDAQKNKPVNETEEEKIARKIKELEESCKSGS